MRVVLEPQGMTTVRDAEFEAMFGLRPFLPSDHWRQAKETDRARDPGRAGRAFSVVVKKLLATRSAPVGGAPSGRAGKMPVLRDRGGPAQARPSAQVDEPVP